ncbi:hypothetical protein BgiMline_011787 [Biomphalaria glabrata]|uniref:Uncharacterized protein LOC129925875 n=1 Tax=Biomphalaria glabrata TaxID=6526 RepID=A0A9W3A7Q4_BIOGL|nr:uncharacterized protein LOC129925875 [Biomphalaria glabrata]XP_055883224.1 uncharacterized protein LOC129925875 [Biomphalaria glabrata]KAI8728645.1 hypothetical protein BgiMline_032537 [Biomphalaria glabrata]KAI8781971.1 hypothetical protein BgiBS90_017367 [Biomphalaria glabrata]
MALVDRIMALPSHVFMFIIDILMYIYHFFDNLALKFEEKPIFGRRQRQPNVVVRLIKKVIHFVLLVIELPVFLVVFFVTAILLSVLAIIETILKAVFVKFTIIFVVALIAVGVYFVMVKLGKK